MAQWTLWSLGLHKVYRPVSLDILDQIKHAEKKNFPRKEAFDFDTELRKKNAEIIVIYDISDSHCDPILAAYAVYVYTFKLALLHKTCVVEKYRRQGVARRMLVEQHTRLRLRGCTEIQLWVDEQRMSARLLYASIGFVEVGRVEDYYAVKERRLPQEEERVDCEEMAFLISLIAFSRNVLAAPRIGLPINAQVPPVARASKAFDFTFSESTFTSTTTTINYATANAPDWLRLDSSSRTFSGVPGLEDTGAVNFSLIATDTTGSTPLPVTFVVSSSPGPGLGIPIDQQLSIHNGYQSPATILLLHSSALVLPFSQDTFTDTSPDTVYYAICANNTPLPSWITFDPNHLSFLGTAPQNTSPDELPQTFDIHLTASDVVGFSAAVVFFQLVLENHLFTFGDHQQVVNVTHGSTFTYEGLRFSLMLDGRPVDHGDVQQIRADKPGWVSFDENSWTLSGVPPDQASTYDISITATDVYGENATTTIVLHTEDGRTADLFNGDLGSLNATAGEDISYRFNEAISSSSGAEPVVDVRPAPWLQFDQAKQQLNGRVPSDLKPQEIMLNVTLTQGLTSQSQPLVINIESASHSSSSRSTEVASTSIASESATSSPTSQPNRSQAKLRTHNSRIAAAIAVPVVSVCLLLILACCFVRRRRQRRSGEDWLSASKKKISRPFLLDDHIEGESIGPMVEKPAAVHKRASSKAPKRRSLLRLSKGTTDEPIQTPRVDSWHEYIQGFSMGRPNQAPPQFSLIPEEQTSSRRERSRFSSRKHPSRSSRPSAVFSVSPTKRFGQRKRRSDMSFASSGLLSRERTSGFGHGNNGSSFSISGFSRGPIGIGHGDGGPPGYGSVRKSWRHPSMESWTPTDSTIKTSDLLTIESERSHGNLSCLEYKNNVASTVRSFPRPPTLGVLDHPSQPAIIQKLEDDYRVRTAGIRAVEPEAPQTYGLPLHAFHKRRARNRHHRNTFFSAGPSSCASSHLDWIQSIHGPILSPTHSMTTVVSGISKKRTASLQSLGQDRSKRTYSQSSSLEPPTSSQRPSPLKPRPSPRKRISGASTGNGGGGLATLVSNAITRRFHSSKSSFASSQRLGSAAGNDNDSELGLSPGMGLAEERDEEGNRRWRHLDVHPNPLGVHTPPSTSARSPNIAEEQRGIDGYGASATTAGMSRQYLQRLSFLRQQGVVGGGQTFLVGESGRGRLTVGSQGKRPVSVDNGLIARGPSMRGDIVREGEGERGREREVAFL
ncbi:MAG: hypothetical protein Q9218_000645 [Villophora microphyllina]